VRLKHTRLGSRRKARQQRFAVLSVSHEGLTLVGLLTALRAAPASSGLCDIRPISSARLSPEGSRLLSYLCVCIACHRECACVHSRCVRCAHQPPGAGPCLSIWLAAPRGAADVYVSLCFGPIWLLPVTSGQSHLCHPFIYGSPASPLLSRAPMTITKYTSHRDSRSTSGVRGI
jgi:hypothetical protein